MSAVAKLNREEKRALKDAALAAELEREREREKLDAPIAQRQLATPFAPAVGESKERESQGEETAVAQTDKEAIRAARDEKVAKLRGRPSGFTPEESDLICTWIAEGKSLRSYCREHAREMCTVYKWLREEKDFAQRYARAHDDRADSLADEIVDIADEAIGGTNDDIQAARLRIDARKWVSSKLKPQKWGDKVEIEQKGHVTFNLAPLRRTIDVTPHSVIPTVELQPAAVLEQLPD